jgi:uncharacterized repeat protein (TIGR03803 family)
MATIFCKFAEEEPMPDPRTLNIQPTQKPSRRLLIACAVLMAFAAVPLQAQTYQDLYDLNCSTGCLPLNYAPLAQGSDGNLYGTTLEGGKHNLGTIFTVTPLGAYTDLWDFDGTTGSSPVGGLTEVGGNFYGTTSAGGTAGFGVVFRFTPPHTVTVLHDIGSIPNDGGSPRVPPTLGKDGNLYGLTDTSTYRITLPGGKYSLLPNPPPSGALSPEVFTPFYLASDGNLYATTFTGGKFGGGTFFSMTTGGAIKVLYNFQSTSTDGTGPKGTLTEMGGNLYGVTEYGGGPADSGTVYEMTLSGSEAVLHVFNATTDGAGPLAGLLAIPPGTFYGTAAGGGSDGNGTVFQMASNGTFGLVIDLTGTTGTAPGRGPVTTLMRHTDGVYYGLTDEGGASAVGTFFSLTPPNILQTLIVDGPIWVKPGVPVEILGNNLSHVISVEFAGVQAQFQPGSDTHLTAEVPSAAIDGPITATLDTGLQIQSQQNMRILPKITNLDPTSGPVGQPVDIVGGGFAGATRVAFGGVKATSFTVGSPSLIRTTVPAGAKTGKVTVTTPHGTAASKQTFTVN